MINKIGIIAPEFPPDIGGVQAYSYELCCQLAKQGYELTILIPESHEHENFEFGNISPISILRLRKRYDAKLIKSFDVDIWHCLNATYSWVALLHPRVFISVHGNDFLNFYLPTARLDLRERYKLPFGSQFDRWLGFYLTKQLVAKSLPRARQIIAVSQYTKQRFLEQFALFEDTVSVIPPGVSDFFFKLPVSEKEVCYESPNFITVCRLSEQRKNVHLVLHALSKLKHLYDFHYTIIGEGCLRDSLQTLVSQLNLSSNVTFLGQVDRATLQKELYRSDLFILTSSASESTIEGFGIVYLEANACGVPVMAAKVGGAIDAVQSSISGFFVDRPEVESINQALVAFINGKFIFKRKLCRSWAEKHKWSDVTQKIIASYNLNVLE